VTITTIRLFDQPIFYLISNHHKSILASLQDVYSIIFVLKRMEFYLIIFLKDF
jgi:hypothetical protein